MCWMQYKLSYKYELLNIERTPNRHICGALITLGRWHETSFYGDIVRSRNQDLARIDDHRYLSELLGVVS